MECIAKKRVEWITAKCRGNQKRNGYLPCRVERGIGE
jgi:hypothetical protein